MKNRVKSAILKW